MESHIALSVVFIKSKNQGDMDKKRSIDCIRRRNSLSPVQGKVAQVKIMLRLSSFDKDESDKKKNQVVKLKFILKWFISFMSIGHRTMKTDATW
jgi:hypothetical protein